MLKPVFSAFDMVETTPSEEEGMDCGEVGLMRVLRMLKWLKPVLMRSERTTRRCRSGDVNRGEGVVRKKKIIGGNNLSPPPGKRCALLSPPPGKLCAHS